MAGTAKRQALSQAHGSVVLPIALAATQGDGEATAPDRIPVFPAPDASGVIHARSVDGRKWKLGDASALLAAHAGRETALMIDYDHEQNIERRGRAAGWVEAALERDDDGSIWAVPDWTPSGAQAVASREYRYVSPAFLHDRDGNVFALDRISLVNNPAFAMQALASLEDNDRPPSRQPERDDMKLSKQALAKLGLDENATEEQVEAALAALEVPATEPATAPAPAATTASSEATGETDVESAAELATANARIAALELENFETKVDTLLASASKGDKPRILPSEVASLRSLCFLEDGRPNKRAFEIIQKKIEAADGSVVATASTVAGRNPPASPAASHGLTETQAAIAKKLGQKPEEYAESLASIRARA